MTDQPKFPRLRRRVGFPVTHPIAPGAWIIQLRLVKSSSFYWRPRFVHGHAYQMHWLNVVVVFVGTKGER